MSYNLTYKEYFSRYYNNNSGYLKKSQVEEVPHPRYNKSNKTNYVSKISKIWILTLL